MNGSSFNTCFHKLPAYLVGPMLCAGKNQSRFDGLVLKKMDQQKFLIGLAYIEQRLFDKVGRCNNGGNFNLHRV